MGPVRLFYVRARVRQQLIFQHGYRFTEALQLAGTVNDETISAALLLADDATKAAYAKLGEIGDGSIIQAILDFLKSPEGQAFIRFIIMLIIGGA